MDTNQGGQERRSTCEKCFALTNITAFFLVGFSLLGTTIYVELQWSNLRVFGQYFSQFVWIFIAVGVTVLASALVMILSTCTRKRQYIYAIILLILLMFSSVAVTLCSIRKPWDKVRTVMDENLAAYQSGKSRVLTEIEETYGCCTAYNAPYDGVQPCGPISLLSYWQKNKTRSCEDLYFHQSYKPQSGGKTFFSLQEVHTACATPCKERLLNLYRMYFFSLLFQTVSAMLLQGITVIILASPYCSAAIRERLCPGRSPARCRVTCDLLGTMCACGCACLKTETTYEDTMPITPMESPPPYTDPVPHVVDDLIDLTAITAAVVHAPPNTPVAGAGEPRMEQTRL